MSMAGRTRQHWPDEVKRRVVVETYAEGASVAEVALRYGINANLVFIWRKDPLELTSFRWRSRQTSIM
jgi:transposase-like protein